MNSPAKGFWGKFPVWAIKTSGTETSAFRLGPASIDVDLLILMIRLFVWNVHQHNNKTSVNRINSKRIYLLTCAQWFVFDTSSVQSLSLYKHTADFVRFFFKVINYTKNSFSFCHTVGISQKTRNLKFILNWQKNNIWTLTQTHFFNFKIVLILNQNLIVQLRNIKRKDIFLDLDTFLKYSNLFFACG